MSTSEKVKLILNKLPMTLSIQEIGDISGYHRNTIRSILAELSQKKQVYQTGKHRTRNFYVNKINQFYRKMAKALPNKAVAHKLGYEFVDNLLRETVNQKNVHWAQKDLHEFEELLSLAFPFIEYVYNEDGTIQPITAISVNKQDGSDYIVFETTVSPCLCNGEDKSGKSCAMVQGTIGATADFVYDTKSIVMWKGHLNLKYPSCKFKIKIPDPHNKKINSQSNLKLDEY